MFRKISLISIIPASFYLKYRLSTHEGYTIDGPNIVYTNANNILSYCDSNTNIKKVKVPFFQNVLSSNNIYVAKSFDILCIKKLDKEMLTELKNNGMNVRDWFTKLVNIALEKDDVSIAEFLCENIPDFHAFNLTILPSMLNNIINRCASSIFVDFYSQNSIRNTNLYKTYLLNRAIKLNRPNIVKYLQTNIKKIN